jgi:thiamine-phosphate pyrophosphorylase
MPPEPRFLPPLLAITLDGTGVPAAEQAERLCAAGVRWVQLRMKRAEPGEWRRQARAAVAACHRHGALLCVNDSVDVALEAGADGVHLGREDGDWAAARARLGPRALLGGTVNHADDAARAAAADLDYVGIGPWRFTPTKQNLSPVLGPDGIRALLPRLGGKPAWVIGGVQAADLPAIRALGAAGAAVAAGLQAGGRWADQVQAYLSAWSAAPVLSP